MLVFTDEPERLAGYDLIQDPAEADAVVAFSPDFLYRFLSDYPLREKFEGKKIFLVARRVPVSLLGKGVEIRPIAAGELEKVLAAAGGGETGQNRGGQKPVVPACAPRAEEPRNDGERGTGSVADAGAPTGLLERGAAVAAYPRGADPARNDNIPSTRSGDNADGLTPIGNVYVSYSPGTDVGKTFVSSNLAAWLAGRGVETVLVDLDMGGSGTWEMVHMRELFGPPRQTLSDWDRTPESISAITRAHAHPSIKNLHVVLRGGTSDPGLIADALRVLSQRYAVVVDTSNNLGIPYIVAALRVAGKVFLIGRLTLKVQTRLSEMYSNARRLIPKDRMVLVVNRVGMKDDERYLHPVDLARQFGFREHYVIHEDERARVLSVKKKTLPVFLGTRASQELRTLFEREVAGVPAGAAVSPEKTSRFKFWNILRR